MKTRKRDDVYKIHRAKPGSKFAKMMANDPVLNRKAEECVKSLTENPPPEWILKKMRGED
ncbi:MAG: hypothetical protein BGO55_27255 [Sphingobacteriales bacterium 50-39]|nr:hypothetical protein [Sphingobacteriales bacterium]OJW56746.1 MAG: hypothetical protein BGO55_27255 [Sphingobacteriales bacterium 50-39]